MGYMTIVKISNDGWETIKRNKEEFIENIEEGMIKKGINSKSIESFSVGNHCSPMSVHYSIHADVPQLILAHKNSMTDLSEISECKDSIENLIHQQESIKLAKNLIKASEEHIYDIIVNRILLTIKNNNKDIKNISFEELIIYVEQDEWRKELNVSVKSLANYIKKWN